MLKSYRVCNPPIKRELPITLSIIRIIKKLAKAPRDKFIASLIVESFFFAMRSCEYTKLQVCLEQPSYL